MPQNHLEQSAISNSPERNLSEAPLTPVEQLLYQYWDEDLLMCHHDRVAKKIPVYPRDPNMKKKLKKIGKFYQDMPDGSNMRLKLKPIEYNLLSSRLYAKYRKKFTLRTIYEDQNGFLYIHLYKLKIKPTNDQVIS